MKRRDQSPEAVVVRDTWPFRVVIWGFFVAVATVWIRSLGVPPAVALLLAVAICMAIALRARHSATRTVATAAGISGLSLRVPRAERASRFSRPTIAAPAIPWDRVESIDRAARSRSLAKVRIRLRDGREAEVMAYALSARGRTEIATALERARATFTTASGSRPA